MTCAPLMDTFSTTVPCVSRSIPNEKASRLLYHTMIHLSRVFSSSFYTKLSVFLPRTNIQQLSRVYHEAPPARIAWSRASRPLYHRVGNLSIGNLHNFFLLTLSLQFTKVSTPGEHFSLLKCPPQENTAKLVNSTNQRLGLQEVTEWLQNVTD